jgi:uncharacterized membrane protein YfcA
MAFDIYLLAILFMMVAVLYSSVGHAGASGYLAAMALLGFAPEQMRPTALALNILVGGIGLVRFHKAGLVPWRKVLPFILASIPAAFLAAQWQVPKETYSLLLGALLLTAAIGAWRSGQQLAEIGAMAGRPCCRRGYWLSFRNHRNRRCHFPDPSDSGHGLGAHARGLWTIGRIRLAEFISRDTRAIAKQSKLP